MSSNISKLMAQKTAIIKEALLATPNDLETLATLIAYKPFNQELVAKLLEPKGFRRLFDLLRHEDDARLRTASLQLLHTIWHRNEKTQMTICEACQFTPLSGHVVLNSAPKSLQPDPGSAGNRAWQEIRRILKEGLLPCSVDGLWVYPEY